MELHYDHSIAFSDLNDLKGVDDIKNDGNNDQMYALKYNKGTFSLSGTEPGVKKLVDLLDVVNPPLDAIYDNQIVMFNFDYKQKTYTLDPLFKDGGEVDDANTFNDILTIGRKASTSRNFPPLLTDAAVLVSVHPILQLVLSQDSFWLRVRGGQTEWNEWRALYRPKPKIDLQISTNTVITNRKGQVRKISNLGTKFVYFAPPKNKKDIVLTRISDDEMGITGGVLKLKTPLAFKFDELKEGLLEIEGYAHQTGASASDRFNITPLIKFTSENDKAPFKLTLKIKDKKAAFVSKNVAAGVVVALEEGVTSLKSIDLTKFSLTSLKFYA